MNIPTKDNVSNEAIVPVMLENDTFHYDTDHDDTHANHDVLPNDRRTTMDVQSRVRGRQVTLPPAARSPLRCTALPALTCLPLGVALPRLPLGVMLPRPGAILGALLCAVAFPFCSGGWRTPHGANSRRFWLRRHARARAVRDWRRRNRAGVTA